MKLSDVKIGHMVTHNGETHLVSGVAGETVHLRQVHALGERTTAHISEVEPTGFLLVLFGAGGNQIGRKWYIKLSTAVGFARAEISFGLAMGAMIESYDEMRTYLGLVGPVSA